MHQYGVDFRFLTMTMGVDPSYKDEAFYRATLDTDAERVNELFAKAKNQQIDIEHRSLSQDSLAALMRTQDHMVMDSNLRDPNARPLTYSTLHSGPSFEAQP